MREISFQEGLLISGAKPKIRNVIMSSALGAITTGFVGLMTAGPPGLIAGLGTGAYMGAAAALAKEGATGIVEIKDEFFNPDLTVKNGP